MCCIASFEKRDGECISRDHLTTFGAHCNMTAVVMSQHTCHRDLLSVKTKARVLNVCSTMEFEQRKHQKKKVDGCQRVDL